MARVAVGSKIPDGELFYMDAKNQLQSVSVHSLAAGKKVVIFGVPGAFTPVCSREHVPGFIEKAKELKAKGVEEIICISVNDPYVMKEWANSYPSNKHIKFLSDGSANYTNSLGLELDLTETGLGVRSQRYALICDDLEVKIANLEEGASHMTTHKVSSAENALRESCKQNLLQPPTKERWVWVDKVLGKTRSCMCA